MSKSAILLNMVKCAKFVIFAHTWYRLVSLSGPFWGLVCRRELRFSIPVSRQTNFFSKIEKNSHFSPFVYVQRVHHTKSLRIVCNVYSYNIKTNKFCAFWVSSTKFCLLSSAKLWFKESLKPLQHNDRDVSWPQGKSLKKCANLG